MWHLKCDPAFENDHLDHFACCGSHARDHCMTRGQRSMHASHSQQASRGLPVGLGAVLSCLEFKLVDLLASI
jgi:hypothetical protein